MYSFFLYGILAGTVLGQTSGTPAKDDASLTVTDRFSIDAPAENYTWKEAKPHKIDGIELRAFTATRPANPPGPIVVLTMEGRKAEGDKARIAALKGHTNGMIETLQKGGFTNLRGKKPNLDPPIEDTFRFSLSADAPDGTTYYIHGATTFKQQRIYLIQVMAKSDKDAEQLAKVIDSLEEISP